VGVPAFIARVRRAPAIAAVPVAALVLVPAALAAAPSLHVQPATVHAGGLVHVRGNADGCQKGSTVFIFSRAFPGHGSFGVGEVKARVRAGGKFRGSVHVRRHAHGRYRVTARCGGGNLGVVAHLRVT
jgi:hypothetical protein